MGPAILIAHGVPSDALHDRVFELLGRRPAEVAYVGAANGDQERWYQRVADTLAERHGAVVRFARTGDPEQLAAARRLLEEAQLIYVAGGDVARLAERLRSSGLDELIRRRHADGTMLVGVSAGAIGLCRYWVRFPEDDPDLDRPTRYPCVGALPLAVDCHDEESDWEELRALLHSWGEDEPDAVVDGWGIPLGGALELGGDGAVRSLGAPLKQLRLDRGRIVE